MKPEEIDAIIAEAFKIPPAERAAQMLYDCGVTEANMFEIAKLRRSPMSGVLDPQWVSTVNALRDLERKKKS